MHILKLAKVFLLIVCLFISKANFSQSVKCLVIVNKENHKTNKIAAERFVNVYTADGKYKGNLKILEDSMLSIGGNQIHIDSVLRIVEGHKVINSAIGVASGFLSIITFMGLIILGSHLDNNSAGEVAAILIISALDTAILIPSTIASVKSFKKNRGYTSEKYYFKIVDLY